MEKGKAKKIRKAGSKKKKRKKGKHRRDKEESLSDSCEDSAEDSDQQNKERGILKANVGRSLWRIFSVTALRKSFLICKLLRLIEKKIIVRVT